MLQTDRKTETVRQSAREQENARRERSREAQANAALALDAILAGGDWSQLPADGVLSLSHRLGNSALLTLCELRGAEPETARLPSGGCETKPLAWDGGEPQLTEPPHFGAFAPMGEAAPLNV